MLQSAYGLHSLRNFAGSHRVVTPAVIRTLRILDYLARHGAQRLSDLAREFDLPKSNIHRLLQSLIEEGFARQEVETGKYLASMKVYELGALIANRDPVKRAATLFVQQLHEATGETVALAILTGIDIVYIERVLARNPLRGSLREGWRVPAAFTAAGKVMLAHRPDGEALLDRILAEVPEASALDRETIIEEFVEIRRKGFAVSQSGWTQGINSVACAIGDPRTAPVGALALVAPAERMQEGDIPKAALQVMAASAQVNDLLSVH